MTRVFNKISEKDKRRELRERATGAEDFLWEHLRNGKLSGVRFKRQYSAAQFVLDFYAPALKLAIEVDGPIHTKTDRIEHDILRTEFLKNADINVIRFSNKEVQNNVYKVLERIKQIINK